jgi:exo-beta-1,3-glucanase (GH17 family)
LFVFLVATITGAMSGCQGREGNSGRPAAIVPGSPDKTPSTDTRPAKEETWEGKMSRIRWVAYSPSTGDPTRGVEPKPEAVKEDLTLLRGAGFTGLVTYGCTGIVGKELPAWAREAEFEGLIIGVWDIKSKEELDAAKACAKDPVVLGICAGNEGYPKRYKVADLSKAIRELRQATGKPVTTTEEIEDYYENEELPRLGDWVFPNAHPYFHHRLDPDGAVRWTVDAYEDLARLSKRFVLFKEVGLPTAGDKEGKMSETAQEQYYIALARTKVRFVYFEAYDLTWKNQLPIEPHWGLSRSDRIPKPLAASLLKTYGYTAKAPPVKPPAPNLDENANIFHVYEDSDSVGNHFKPTGYMGDCGDIQIDETSTNNPYSGKTCIRVVYTAKGKGPHECDYPGPCKWSGVYWQHPPNNWGKEARLKGQGFDLSRYNRLVFWARADKDCSITFMVGGINETYGDSLRVARKKTFSLTREWQKCELDLSDGLLQHIIGGFGWVTNWDTNPLGALFYIDEIKYVKE